MKCAAIIALIYLLFGLIWIYAGDYLLFSIWKNDLATLQLIGTYKGYLYVLISTGLIFLLINGAFKSVISDQEQINVLFSNPLIGLIKQSIGGEIQTLSQNIATRLGYKDRKELIGMQIQEITHPDDIKAEARYISQLQNEHTDIYYQEKRLMHQDGSAVWVRMTGTVKRKGNQIDYIISSIKDISDQKIAEERLDQELREKNALINNTDDLIWSIDRDMKLRSCNDRYLEVIEQDTGQKLKPGDSILPPEYGESLLKVWQQYYERALRGESIQKTEHIDWKNKMTYMDISLHPIYHEGQVMGVSCFSKDVTTKTQALLALRESEKKYRQYLERISDAYAAVDNEWRFTYVNRKAGEIWEKAPEYLIGKNIWEELGRIRGERFYEMLHRAKATQEFAYQENYVQRYDKWFATFVYPDKTGLSVFFHDITAHIQAQQQLKERETMLSRIFHSTTDAMGLAKINEAGEFIYVSANLTATNMFQAQAIAMDKYYGKEIKQFVQEVLGETQAHAQKLESEYRLVAESHVPVKRQASYTLKQSTLYTETTLNPIIDDQGTCTHVLWVLRDVSEQKAAQKIILDNQRQLRLIYNSTTEMMILVRCESDDEYIVESANRSFMNMVRQTHPTTTLAGVKDRSMKEFLPKTILIDKAATYKIVEENMRTAAKTSKKVRIQLNNLIEEQVHAYEIAITPIYEGKQATSHLLLVIYDQTDKITQEERSLIAINKAVEAERMHIARELHDSLTQTLSIASINLKNLNYDVGGLQEQKKYQHALQYLDEAIDESRAISHRIMPKAIRDFGLIPSIEELIEHTRQLHEVDIFFSYNRKIRFSDEVEINLFRIVQQAINNALTHANPSQISIELQIEAPHIQLSINDDGQGFIPHQQPPINGIGIRTMQSRAIQLGGILNVESQPNKGTHIHAKIPIAYQSNENQD